MQRVTASVKPVPPSPAATRASAARKRGREEVAPTSPQPAPVSSLVVSANAPLPAAVVWVGERIGTCHYPAAQFGGRVYHVSDTVLLQSGLAQPFVCRIERMMQKGPRKVMFVRWMFRPADVPDAAEMLQREPYAQEVFLTDVVEENDLATILARCYVLPPHRYAHLPSTLYDANVFCCSLLFRTQRECFEPLDVMRVGPLYAEPPARAPRINMPAVPLSGVPFPGFARGPKKKKRANGAVLSCDAPSVSAACVCCIDKCDNICWSRLHPSTVLMHDWVYKPRGRFVCEQHLLRDMRLRSHKRSRSLTDPRLCAPASLTMAPANGEHQEADKRAKRASSVDSWSKRCSADKAEERFNEYGPRGVVVRSWDASSGGTRIVGEIIIHARTTIHEVREMIRQELGVASPFLLKKCNIPLPRNIDGKRASLFVGSPEEYFVVAPSV